MHHSAQCRTSMQDIHGEQLLSAAPSAQQLVLAPCEPQKGVGRTDTLGLGCSLCP